jgi:hypothetical protein
VRYFPACLIDTLPFMLVVLLEIVGIYVWLIRKCRKSGEGLGLEGLLPSRSKVQNLMVQTAPWGHRIGGSPLDLTEVHLRETPCRGLVHPRD